MSVLDNFRKLGVFRHRKLWYVFDPHKYYRIQIFPENGRKNVEITKEIKTEHVVVNLHNNVIKAKIIILLWNASKKEKNDWLKENKQSSDE